ncbi:MAG: protein translocase subunit SecD [Burkholderiaceae bacterium]
MNRYPVWKFALMALAVVFGLLYTVPNLYGDAPAVQVSASKLTTKVGSETVTQVQQLLSAASITPDYVNFEGTSVHARFATTDIQIHARDVINAGLNAGSDKDAQPYAVALNMVPRSPRWMASLLHALPMYLGLDLRGGVHFLLQVDLKAALDKKIEVLVTDTRTLLREKQLRTAVSRDGSAVTMVFHDQATATQAVNVLTDGFTDAQWTSASDGTDVRVTGVLKQSALIKAQDQAIKQNMTTLGNRVAGLGTSEPVIQQQGADRIVVELPGIQDTTKAKELIGRTATLEIHMVDQSAEGAAAATGGAAVPLTDDLYPNSPDVSRHAGASTVVKKEIVISGDDLANADANFDNQNNGSIVKLQLNAKGARSMKDVSSQNIGKLMSIVLFEKGKGQVISVATIQSELGENFQISGIGNAEEATELALLLRSGALAAPMEFIEETAIGPSLGADNIAKGLHSVAWGFAAILVFMCAYYLLFGVISTLSLGVNLLLLVAILSLIQTTLTLPGIAAIALTLGMAIDANVLVNERIREELRAGSAPQTAIAAGYERAWATILDSNITTLIAGGSLLLFGSGAIKGFAIVHCLGILTSMFSAVFFSRGLVNVWYGRQKKLKSILIGQVWKGGAIQPGNVPQPDDLTDAAELAKRPDAAR